MEVRTFKNLWPKIALFYVVQAIFFPVKHVTIILFYVCARRVTLRKETASHMCNSYDITFVKTRERKEDPQDRRILLKWPSTIL